ncbi:class I SAM-dependent methyltransferase [Prosthecobacter sp. SYSU 5D2]|uniref:tRNA (mnm(5)s(2)U34)-methyltransferase n=1 Tax=Prosthecobacter sp. SYSU 5D2 TaxID=3134134 RepID=UPI0031FF3CC9
MRSPRFASPTGGLPSAVRWAQLLLADRLQAGDIALDATAGNGHDTLFLCQCTGTSGHVYAMDVQAAAVAATRSRLLEAGIQENRFTVVQAGHETMAGTVVPEHQGKLAGIMFNLGYLPGSDKTVITRTETTLAAVNAATRLLKPGGLLTIAVYPGHEGGAQEQRALGEWAAGLSPREFEVQHLRPVNRNANPPECWLVWKTAPSHGK